MKFGGTSVRDADAFERVAKIVQTEIDNSPLVVTSAMSGMTDALIAAFNAAQEGGADSAADSLEPFLDRHRAVAESILDDAGQETFREELALARNELKDLLSRASRRSLPLPMLKDAVVSYGEQLSSLLLSLVLRARGLNGAHIDSRRVIVTDDSYGAAEPQLVETQEKLSATVAPLLAEGRIPVMGGFIGSSRSGETTTLGRGGSDYSAAIVGGALGAREIQIWTDVTGVLTTDPRICPDARTLNTLSYEEAAELAYFGAKVLHPKTIQPAVDRQIPVRVCNSNEPDKKGTMILPRSQSNLRLVKSIAYKKGITTLHITSARMLGAYGFLSAIFQVFERQNVPIDVIATSEVSVSLTLDSDEKLAEVVSDLERFASVDIERGMAVVCVVGHGVRGKAGVAAQIFETIKDYDVSLISHTASSVNMTFVVDEKFASDVVGKLHRSFFPEGGLKEGAPEDRVVS